MGDEFIFQGFNKQGNGSASNGGPAELHSMPRPPTEEKDLPAEMKQVITQGRKRIEIMIRNGISCEDITTKTNLPLEYVQGIQREMKNGK